MWISCILHSFWPNMHLQNILKSHITKYCLISWRSKNCGGVAMRGIPGSRRQEIALIFCYLVPESWVTCMYSSSFVPAGHSCEQKTLTSNTVSSAACWLVPQSHACLTKRTLQNDWTVHCTNHCFSAEDFLWNNAVHILLHLELENSVVILCLKLCTVYNVCVRQV